jgi:hypothetical protein
MDMPNSNIITVHDAATGETIVREMNKKELEHQALIIAETETQAAAKVERAAARAGALAKLKVLGLTDDEIAALIGG